MEKNVLISGYYGYGNTGDEAILSSILDLLKTEVPEIKSVVLSGNPGITEKEHSVSAVYRYSMTGLFKALWKCDLLISGGGGLLQDSTGIKTPVYYLGMVFLAKLLRKKVMYYAQGIGPLSNSLSRFLTSYVSNMVDFITVRDENSFYLLRALDVTGPPVKITTDPVFAMLPAGKEEISKIFEEEKIPDDGMWLGISVRKWKSDNDYLSHIASLADYFHDNFSVNILFIPMHLPEDYDISIKIRDLMKSQAYILRGKYHPKIIMGILGKMEIMISMRLHALIMSSALTIPSIPLVYDPKVEEISKQLGLKSFKLESLSFSEIKEEALSLWNGRREASEKIRVKAGELRELAMENVRAVKELLLIP